MEKIITKLLWDDIVHFNPYIILYYVKRRNTWRSTKHRFVNLWDISRDLILHKEWEVDVQVIWHANYCTDRLKDIWGLCDARFDVWSEKVWITIVRKYYMYTYTYE